jgi:hypothetical protein
MHRAVRASIIVGGMGIVIGLAALSLMPDQASPERNTGSGDASAPSYREKSFPDQATALAAEGRYAALWGTDFSAAIPPAIDDDAYHPPQLATTTGHLPIFVNRKTTEKRVTSDISTRLRQVSHETDLTALASVVLDIKDSDTVRHEAIEILRRSSYPLLNDLLIAVFSRDDESERFRSFLAQHIGLALADARDERQGTLLHVCRAAFAGDRHLAVRRQMLQNLFRQHDEPIITLLKTEGLTGNRTIGMRDLAIRYLHDLDVRSAIPAIRDFIASDDEVQAVAAIYVLGAWRDGGAKNSLLDAARSNKPRIKRAAEAALVALGSGE